MTLDMSGELVLKDDLVTLLGGLTGSDPGDREPIRIPLARVTNTISDPKVEMTPQTIAANRDQNNAHDARVDLATGTWVRFRLGRCRCLSTLR